MFAVDPSSGASRRLTDEPGVVHRWGLWLSDGSGVVCAANGRDRATFDVVRVAGDDRTRLYEHGGDSQITPVGWGPDTGRLLVLETRANGDETLAVVETGSGTLTRVGTDETDSRRLRSLAPAPGEDAVYAVTEHDSDRRGIYRIDLQNAQTTPVVTTDANLKSLSVDPDSGRVVYEREHDGTARLQTGMLKDTTTVESLPEPALDSGYFGPIALGPDGERAAVVYYRGVAPPQVYTVELATGETTQWTYLTNPSMTDDPPVPSSVRYDSDGVDVHGFHTTPSTDGPRPAIVYFHPGPTQQAHRTFNPLRRYFVGEGYAYFEPNYRGSSGYGRRFRRLDHGEGRFDAVADARRAVDWVADRPSVDDDRVVLLGHSYGGFLALAAATTGAAVGATAALAPITDFETFLQETEPWRRANREAEYGSLDDDRDLLRRLSPTDDLGNAACPLLFIHGTGDSTVPPTQSKRAVETAAEHDVDVNYEFLEGADHGLTANDDRVAAFGRVAEFFDRHVGEDS
ncbi:alpha/beta fold hydrolase [Halobaculum sp. MBLA0143]|uniref:S9 family peptidase n=1 Tax=Halobaculum sp. MBLA0143 TaxID=3079933 RepID=UPI003523CD06